MTVLNYDLLPDMMKSINLQGNDIWFRDANGNAAEREEFEGKYRIVATRTICKVEPIKMAFEVKCTNLKTAQIYFYSSDLGNKPKFATEKKAANLFSTTTHFQMAYLSMRLEKARMSPEPTKSKLVRNKLRKSET